MLKQWCHRDEGEVGKKEVLLARFKKKSERIKGKQDFDIAGTIQERNSNCWHGSGKKCESPDQQNSQGSGTFCVVNFYLG